MTFVEMVFGKPAEGVRLSDIQALIDNRIEESHHLEYKCGKTLGKPEDLSRWISAFLNAEGGLIVIGVSEDNPANKERLDAKVYPQAIEYAPRGFTRERVEQIVHANIRGDDRPHIAVFPVRGEGNNCVYLLEVPQGQAPPYQAADGKYYRRLNFTKYAMAHYEIADFFGRRRKPALRVEAQVTTQAKDGNTWQLRLQLFILNTGRAVARSAEFAASFENAAIEVHRGSGITRIDDIRGGVPSIQCNLGQGVIHPAGDRLRTQFADLELRQREAGTALAVQWGLIAEDFELTEGRLELDEQLLESLQPGDPSWIPLPPAGDTG